MNTHLLPVMLIAAGLSACAAQLSMRVAFGNQNGLPA
jgi:hypothetical protein